MRPLAVRLSICTIVTAALFGNAGAQTIYMGRIGVGYDVHDYKGSASEQLGSSTLRQLFRHSIDFGISSNFFSERIGYYSFELSLDGYYEQATIATGRTSNYYSPDLKNFSGALSLLPRTRVPISLYLNQRHYFSLNYEPKNRFVVISERPNLAVVRKYENKLQSVGGEVAFKPHRTLTFRGLLQQAHTSVNRLYDYGEDQDIFSQIIPQQSPPGLPDYLVVFTNSLPETLTVFMDDTVLIQALEPQGQLLITIPSGLHRFEIRAPTFNPYTITYDVNSSLLWVVLYNAPSTPNDRDADITSGQVSALYEPSDRLRNEFRLSSAAQEEAILQSESNSRILYNNLTYHLNSKSFIQALTTQSRLSTRFVGAAEEVQNALSQFTTFSYTPSDRSELTFGHNYNLLTNRGLRTTINSVDGLALRRFTNTYTADLRVQLMRISDTRGFTKNELTAFTGHVLQGIKLWFSRTTVRERFSVKTSTERNPSRAQTEYLNRFALDNELGRWGALGDVTLAGEYSTRWFQDVSGDILENKIRLYLGILNNNWSRVRLAGFLIREVSMITGTGSQAGISNENTTARFSANFRLAEKMVLMGSAMLVDQRDVDIKRFMGSFNWKIPLTPATHRISYQEEHKSFLLLDPEVYKTFAQRINFRWRRIELQFQHEIVFEEVRQGRARYQGVRVSAKRGFNL